MFEAFFILFFYRVAMWLESYADKLAHFFDYLLPKAKFGKGFSPEIIGENGLGSGDTYEWLTFCICSPW